MPTEELNCGQTGSTRSSSSGSSSSSSSSSSIVNIINISIIIIIIIMVNTSGAAAKVTNFAGLGEKVRPGTIVVCLSNNIYKQLKLI